MAKKKKDALDDQLVAVEETLSRTEAYIEKNQSKLITIVGVVVGIIAVYLAYGRFIVQPQQEEAMQELVWAKLKFEADSFQSALNGNMQNMGLLDHADEYSGTPAGETSRYMAGIALMRTNDFTGAIAQLDQCSFGDPIMQAATYGAIGDCFAEIDQPAEAQEYFAKAADSSSDILTAPIHLLKAGKMAEYNGQHSQALKFYERIRNDYPDSQEALQIDASIAKVKHLTSK